MKELDDEERLDITAHHEAAHAVACYLLHKRFKCVTVNAEGKKLGEIIYPKKIRKPIPSERDLAVIRREYMVFLAGPIAEGILSGKCEFNDILPLLRLPVSPADGNQRSDRLFWKMQFVETKLLIYAPWNWQAVKALAKELLTHGTMQYQAARRIIRQAMEDYHEGVRNGISALHYSKYLDFVKRVSDEKTRSKERVQAIISEITGRRR